VQHVAEILPVTRAPPVFPDDAALGLDPIPANRGSRRLQP